LRSTASHPHLGFSWCHSLVSLCAHAKSQHNAQHVTRTRRPTATHTVTYSLIVPAHLHTVHCRQPRGPHVSGQQQQQHVVRPWWSRCCVSGVCSQRGSERPVHLGVDIICRRQWYEARVAASQGCAGRWRASVGTCARSPPVVTVDAVAVLLRVAQRIRSCHQAHGTHVAAQPTFHWMRRLADFK
jgi:hypothetical protein